MKNNMFKILSHLFGILFLIIVAFLTWSLSESFLHRVLSFIFLYTLLAVLILRSHNRLQNAIRMLKQYDTDAVSQGRMLHLQKTMLELSNQMTKVNGLYELLDIILKKAIEVIPEAKFGSILVMNEDGLLEFHALYGFDEDLYQVKLDPKESYQWRATAGNFSGPLIIQDLSLLSKDFMTEGTYSTMNELDALSAKSSLSAPLLIDGQFFGSINIDSTDTNVFREEDKKLMAYFANQATIAIRNHQYYEKMLFLSKYDGLTGVMNRHYFQEHIESMLQKGTQEKEPITFVLMDLNHFKDINDQYGHASGDNVLAFFSKSFSSQIQLLDLFARYGGDEFIAVFFNKDSINTAQKLQSIHENIRKEPIRINPTNQEVYCHFSYGMAEFPTESTEFKTLIQLADQRMYQHKSALSLEK